MTRLIIIRSMYGTVLFIGDKLDIEPLAKCFRNYGFDVISLHLNDFANFPFTDLIWGRLSLIVVDSFLYNHFFNVLSDLRITCELHSIPIPIVVIHAWNSSFDLEPPEEHIYVYPYNPANPEYVFDFSMGLLRLHQHISEGKTEKTLFVSKYINSSAKLDALLRLEGFGLCILDANGKIIERNAGFDTLFGITKEEIIGKNIQKILECEGKMFLGCNKKELELRVRVRSSGKEFKHIRYYVSPIMRSDGLNIGYTMLFLDISEHKNLEQQLEIREGYLTGLAKIAQKIFLVSEGSMELYPILEILGEISHTCRVYVYMNHVSESGEEFTSQTYEWCIPGAKSFANDPKFKNISYSQWLPRWYEVLSQGGIIEGNIDTLPEDERWILEERGVISVLAIPLLVKDKFVGFIGFDNCDFKREWKTAEVSLLRSVAASISQALDIRQKEIENRRLRKAIEATEESVVVTDRNGFVLYANPAFCKVTGYDIQEIKDKKLSILKSGQHGAEFYKRLWNVILSGQTWSGVFINKKKNGKLFLDKTLISPVFDDEGNITHFIGIKRDVTEEYRLEKELQHAQKMQAIGTLAGGIAHEFNNILAGVIGYSELILMEGEHVTNVKLIERVKHIRKMALRGAELVKQLLTFARREGLKVKKCDLNKEIFNIERLLRGTIGKTIVIDLKLKPGIREIHMDPTRLKQVLVNLAINARDAMPNGGKLIIETGEIVFDEKFCREHVGANPGEYVFVSFSDTGCGMDEDTRKRIFEPFFTTKGGCRGIGLGLSIVYGIVKDHNGYIDVISSPNKGTTFYLYFPVAKEENLIKSSKNCEPFLNKGDNKKQVLLVDDEEYIRRIGKEILNNIGFHCIPVSNASKAIKVFEKMHDKIDLVILDLIMPGITGWDCLKALLDIDADARILIASGYLQDDQISHLKSLGASGVIAKPYTAEKLSNTISTIFKNGK